MAQFFYWPQGRGILVEVIPRTSEVSETDYETFCFFNRESIVVCP